jgi:hypothetical protein
MYAELQMLGTPLFSPQFEILDIEKVQISKDISLEFHKLHLQDFNFCDWLH